MLIPWLMAVLSAPPTYGPGLYRGDILIPTATVTVALTLRVPLTDGFVDIPQQGLRRHPISALVTDSTALRFDLPGEPGEARFVLQWRDSRFEGIYSQGDRSYPVALAPVPAATRVTEALRGVRREVRAALQADGAPSLAYAVVLDGHRSLEAMGPPSVGAPGSITPDTPFALGTVTRSVVSVAVARQIEADSSRISWLTPVADILPRFRLARPDGGLSVTVSDLLGNRVPFASHEVLRRSLASAAPGQVLNRMRGLPTAEDWPVVTNGFFSLSDDQARQTDWPYAVLGQLLPQPPGVADGASALEDGLLKQADLTMSYDRSASRAREHRLAEGKVVVDPEPVQGLRVASGLFGSARSLAAWLQIHLDHRTISAESWARLEELEAGGWRRGNRRGHRVRQIVSREGGTSVALVLAPDDRAGVAVLTNRGDSDLAELTAHHLLDRLLGLVPRVNLAYAAREATRTVPKVPALPVRVGKTRPAHRRADYFGRYTHPAYGDLLVAEDEQRLTVRLGPWTNPLTHWHYETFVSEPTSPPGLPQVPWTFHTDVRGVVVAVEAPLEPKRPPLRFVRTDR